VGRRARGLPTRGREIVRYSAVTTGRRLAGNTAAQVLVDLRWAQGQPAGTGVYIREMAVALSRHLTVRGLVKAGPRPELPFVVDVLPDGPKFRFDVLESVVARRSGLPLITISRIPVLLAREQTIPIVLDLTPLLFPQTHPTVRGALERLTYPVAARADTIITLSQTSRRDLIQRLSIPERKICVVFPGTSSVEHEALPPKRLQELGIRGDYVLAVGTLEPRKNLSTLIDAFSSKLADLPLQLVVAGGLGWKYRPLLAQMAPLERTGRLVHLGYVTEAKKSLLYRHAVCLAYPSLYEGFGLPILEAMTHGAPVVVSSAPACVEVAGEAGITVDPRDTAGWADAIARLVRDRALREELRRSGKERAKQFSWQRSIMPLVDRLSTGERTAAA